MADWQKVHDDWKKVLDKPKNLALKGGGGTGIGKAIEEVKPLDAAFEHDYSTYAVFIGKLNTLIATCTATENKHKNLFTEACAEAASVRRIANGRKESAKQEYEKAVNEIKIFCNGVVNELKHVPNDRVKAQAHWEHILNVLPKLSAKISALRPQIEHLRQSPPPNVGPRPIDMYADSIEEFVGHLPHP